MSQGIGGLAVDVEAAPASSRGIPGGIMEKLKAIWRAIAARLFNWYSLRALLVLSVSAIAPHLDPRISQMLLRLVDVLDLGNPTGAALAVFGGGYVLRDLAKARAKAMPEAGPDYSWIAK